MKDTAETVLALLCLKIIKEARFK